MDTPTSSTKRKPRAAPSKRSPTFLQKIKQELEADSASESEYTESPVKTKKKRVRSRKASAKKNYAEYVDEDYVDCEDEAAEVKQKYRPQQDWDGDEYVDEAGGVNVLIEGPSSSEPSPTEATFPRVGGKSVGGKHFGGSHQMGGKYLPGYKPNPQTTVDASCREDSFAATTPSPGAVGGLIEDVFVDQNGAQSVHPSTLFAGGHSGSFSGLSGMHFTGFPHEPAFLSSMYSIP